MIVDIIEKLKTIDLSVLICLVILLGLVMVMNIILGSVLAGLKREWNFKTFITGVIKAFLVGLVIVGFGYTLQAMEIVLAEADITVPDGMINLIEIIGVILVAFKKYAKGVWDKLLVILDVTQEEAADVIDEINGVTKEEIKEYESVEGEG